MRWGAGRPRVASRALLDHFQHRFLFPKEVILRSEHHARSLRLQGARVAHLLQRTPNACDLPNEALFSADVHSPACGNYSTPSIRLRSVNATSTRERRNSSSTGVGTCPVMRRSLSSCTWNERRAGRMKRSSFEKRFTSSSLSGRRVPDETCVNSFVGAESAWRSAWRSSPRQLRLGTHSPRISGEPLGEILRESLLIGGWVAMWRPLEVFLYDWWPIREEARLFDRLSAMPVRIVCM